MAECTGRNRTIEQAPAVPAPPLAHRAPSAYLTDMTISTILATILAPRRRLYIRRTAPLMALLLFAPGALETQQQAAKRRACPQFARVPGYGACTNIGGSTCGFCTYRCNDETVVRWNVCQQ